MVKAVAGGGGRGMRVGRHGRRARADARALPVRGARRVRQRRRLRRAAARRGRATSRCRSSATAAAAVSHLCERECSMQRRHQKLVEIAPAPGLDRGVRAAICGRCGAHGARAAPTAASARSSSWSTRRPAPLVFIEANPRLQVEHTVTEEVTGVDLVRDAARSRAGRTLDGARPDQADVRRRGACAIQAARQHWRRCGADGSDRAERRDARRVRAAAGPACASTAAATPATRPARASTRCSRRSIVHASCPVARRRRRHGLTGRCASSASRASPPTSPFLRPRCGIPSSSAVGVHNDVRRRPCRSPPRSPTPIAERHHGGCAATSPGRLAGAQLDRRDPLAVLASRQEQPMPVGASRRTLRRSARMARPSSARRCRARS